MTTELKPCPFCGAVCTSDKYGFDHPEGDGCILGDASFAWCLSEQWNHRPQPIVTTDGLVEELRKETEASARCSSTIFDARIDVRWRAADRIASLERVLSERREKLKTLRNLCAASNQPLYVETRTGDAG